MFDEEMNDNGLLQLNAPRSNRTYDMEVGNSERQQTHRQFFAVTYSHVERKPTWKSRKSIFMAMPSGIGTW